MRPPKARFSPFWQGAGFSVLVHAALLALLYFLFVFQWRRPVTVQLDLSMLPPPPSEPPLPAFRPRPRDSAAPAPRPMTRTAQPGDEAPPACPPPCPRTPGAYLPAALAAQGPRWVSGFIQDSDYPRLAQKSGQDGLVVLAVYLDASGMVREVDLLKGSYPVLNEVALRKVKAARFSPARDAGGNAIPCKLILPIKFELE